MDTSPCVLSLQDIAAHRWLQTNKPEVNICRVQGCFRAILFPAEECDSYGCTGRVRTCDVHGKVCEVCTREDEDDCGPYRLCDPCQNSLVNICDDKFVCAYCLRRRCMHYGCATILPKPSIYCEVANCHSIATPLLCDVHHPILPMSLDTCEEHAYAKRECGKCAYPILLTETADNDTDTPCARCHEVYCDSCTDVDECHACEEWVCGACSAEYTFKLPDFAAAEYGRGLTTVVQLCRKCYSEQLAFRCEHCGDLLPPSIEPDRTRDEFWKYLYVRPVACRTCDVCQVEQARRMQE